MHQYEARLSWAGLSLLVAPEIFSLQGSFFFFFFFFLFSRSFYYRRIKYVIQRAIFRCFFLMYINVVDRKGIPTNTPFLAMP